ncbi:MAG TPA: endolytic transglycosylase MltG [Acidobacteriota bacterium]
MPLRVLKAGLLLTTVAFFWLAFWFVMEYRSFPARPPEPVFFEVKKGKSVEAIARDLKDHRLIRSREAFLAAYRLFFSPRSLKAGEYRFEAPVGLSAVLEALSQGRIYLLPVTIPEGLTGQEIAVLLEEKGIVAAADFSQEFERPELIASWDPEARDLEGYLYPETYQFSKNTPAAGVAGRIVDQFKSTYKREWRRRAADLGWSVRQVVILASLIEKETSRPEERALISAVFHNRLNIGMKLDCDPTIIYALKKKGLFDGDLRFRDMKLDNPYNTYLHGGLPPGPICNPGRGSLEAALYPAAEPYLYFVAKQDGRHQFSLDYGQHRQAVLKYQK